MPYNGGGLNSMTIVSPYSNYGMGYPYGFGRSISPFGGAMYSPYGYGMRGMGGLGGLGMMGMGGYGGYGYGHHHAFSDYSSDC